MLKRLVKLDSVAMLGILRESLTGWDALDADLHEALGRSPAPAGVPRSATQVRAAPAQGTVTQLRDMFMM